MIPPNIQSQALDEAPFEVFWEAAEALGVLVFIHPCDATPTGLLARCNLAGKLIDTGLAAAAIICGCGLTPTGYLNNQKANCTSTSGKPAWLVPSG